MRRLAASLVAAFVSAANPALARDISIDTAWTRATPKGATVAAGYLVIHNAGDADDRLIGIIADFAAGAEPHEMHSVDGVMQMREMAGGVVVPAHGAATFAPGGSHIMFTGLRAPLRQGEAVTATFTFAHGGAIAVKLPVLGLGSTGPAN